MTNEEMLLKLLEGQEGLNKRLDGMDKHLDGMDKRLDGMDKRLDKIENRLDDMENEAKITRNAVNYIGDKLEELITVLNETNVVEIKY